MAGLVQEPKYFTNEVLDDIDRPVALIFLHSLDVHHEVRLLEHESGVDGHALEHLDHKLSHAGPCINKLSLISFLVELDRLKNVDELFRVRD